MELAGDAQYSLPKSSLLPPAQEKAKARTHHLLFPSEKLNNINLSVIDAVMLLNKNAYRTKA